MLWASPNPPAIRTLSIDQMSRENAETIRSVFEAFNRGDMAALLECLDPQIEWHVPPMLPEQTVYRGHEGVRDLWRSMQGSFEDFRLTVEEILDAGDRVMVLAAAGGRGKGSGIDVQTPSFGWIWTVRDGKAQRVEVYPTRAEALKALQVEGPRE